MNESRRQIVWLVVFMAAVSLGISPARAAANQTEDLQAFGRLPVSAEGRVKPFDTVARTSLMILSGRQTFSAGQENRQPAVRWLLDVIARPKEANAYKVFRVDHSGVLALIGRTNEDGKRFSFDEIWPYQAVISEQARLASQVKPKQRNAFQRQLIRLFRNLKLYVKLSAMETPYAVPPLAEGQQWRPFSEVYQEARQGGDPHPAVEPIAMILKAYHDGKPHLFGDSVRRYSRIVAEQLPQETRRAGFEVLFNRFAPFYKATVLYAVGALMACVAFLLRCTQRDGAAAGWSRVLGNAAVWLLGVTFLLHTAGLASRVYLQGRPPVTNLYSSAIFVGWGCVLMALLMERVHRLGIGSVTAGVVGFTTLIVAHNLVGDGDTMEMMQAVLDSNFWLATHVVAVTAGYSATFLAGFLAIAYILLGVFTRLLKPDMSKAIGQMVYGTVCFAALLSFVGTVLGGIWADQSWGRFWGWDPKENGAVLVVMMNVLILHARWGGMIKLRGLMVLAVGGNIVTSWSWFGTNMLGVGLHSYGFMDSALFWLLLFVVSQLAIMGVGAMPIRSWRSFSETDPTRSGRVESGSP